jgi:hypothetical protein
VINEESQDVGGKGGGSSKVTTRNYTYFRSFAIAICAGPITSIDKIWANGKVVYDYQTVQDEATNEGITFKQALDKYATSAGTPVFSVYYGDETQTPDPIIEAVEGYG